MTPRRLRPLLLAWLLPVALGLPFIGRAPFVDDHYHALMAQGLLEDPARPYDFKADDDGPDNAGWERGRPPRMVNPPLHHYLLALALKAGGGRLWVARLGALFLAGLAAVFFYLLAQRLLVPPWPATALAALTPAFWLSSYSLLIDTTMLAFFLAALVFWIDGLRRRSGALLLASGVLMGLTCLTKYTGAFVIVLAAAWWALAPPPEGRSWKALLYLLAPAGLLAGWTAWTIGAYGESHLLASARRGGGGALWAQALVGFAFFGGVFLFPLAAWRWVWEGPRKTFVVLAGASAALWLFLSGPWGGFTAGQGFGLAFLAGGALAFYACVFRPRGAIDLFLLFWLVLGTAQLLGAIAWVAARYYLVLLPPAVFLFHRAVEDRYRHAPARLARFHAGCAAVLFFFGLFLAAGDYAQADTNRRIQADLARDNPAAQGRRCFYLWDSFTGDSLKPLGWRPAFESTPLAPGDLVLRRERAMPPWWFGRRAPPTRVVGVYEYRSFLPLRTMDGPGAAGFYASVWGALPFTFTRGPLERYWLLEVLPREGA